MQRVLWGECGADKSKKPENLIPVAAKWGRLEELKKQEPVAVDELITVEVKNPLVTQTIEVMKQTEMLRSLIDTYSNKTDSTNYLVNPCQIIPEVDFPPENVAHLVTEEKFTKPIWFACTKETPFTRGDPCCHPQINAEVCRASIRKAVCGQLCVAGFEDSTESGLVLFTDAVSEFMMSFMQQLREVQMNNARRELDSVVDIPSLEKAYFHLTNYSLIEVHNYYKHNIVTRNRSEIAEFNGVFEEYDKLMKESQKMQKTEYQEEYINIVEVPPCGESVVVANDGPSVTGEGVVINVQHAINYDGNSAMQTQYVGKQED